MGEREERELERKVRDLQIRLVDAVRVLDATGSVLRREHEEYQKKVDKLVNDIRAVLKRV